MANEFVVRKGLIVSGSAEVENAVIARSITGSFSGSLSAPGSNTQVVFNNAGTLAADSGLVYSSGNVGIGITAPDSKLHVVGTVKFQDGLTISGSTPAITLRETGAGTGDAIIAIGGQKMTVYTGRTGTSRNDFWMRVGDGAVSSRPAIFTSGSNGFTGLGTETPNERLEVAGNVRLPNSGRVYLWRDDNSNYIDNINWIASSGTTQTIQNTGVGGITFKTLTDTRMFISSSGNVGIGTTNPLTTLQVNGTAQFGDAGSMASSGASVNIRTTATGSIAFTHTAVRTYTLGIDTSGTFKIRDHDAPADRLSITSGGNVGIGTTSPAGHQLDIASTQGSATNSAIRALYPAGGGLLNTEFGALAHRGGVWTAVYGKQGSASSAGYFDGNVGIGITTPSQKLTVAGDALITGSLTVQGTITAKEFKTEFVSASITYISGSHKFGDTADDIHQFTGSVFVNGPLTATSFTGSFSGSVSGPVTAPGSDTQIVFNNAGLLSANSGLVYSGSNVGIGTANPNAKLTVLAGNVEGVRIQSSNSGFIEVGKTAGGRWRWANDYNTSNTLELLVNNLTGSSPTQNVLTVNGSNGNLGIGTTAPAQKLDIVGNTQVSGQFAQGVTVANKLVGYGAEFRSSGASAQIFFGRDGSSIGSGAIGADVNHSFAVFTTSSFAKQFVVSQAGSVGIGTTSPSTTLNVIGTTGDFKLERTGYTSFVQLGLPSGVPTIVGNGNLALGGNGAYTTHMFISASGNIGIGTTNPVTQLTVRGSSANTVIVSGTTIEPASNFVPSNNIGNLTVGFNTTTADSYLYSGYTTGALIFGTRIAPDNFERMRITAAGNVGISTISPQRRLHIDASGSANSDLPLALTTVDINNRSGILFASSSLAAGKQHRLYHRVNTPNVEWLLSANAGETATWNFLPVDDTNFGVSIRAPRNGGTALITTGVSQSLLSLGAGGVSNQHLNIASTGNVGIGTTNPTNRLQVQPALIPFDLNGLSNGAIALTNNSNGSIAPTIGGKSTTTGQPGLQFITGTNDTNTGADMVFSVRESDNTDFSTLTSSAYRFSRFTTPLVDILRNGNVGIGTTTPTSKLHVAGAGTFSDTISTTDGTVNMFISYNTMGVVGTLSNHDLQVRTDNTERFRITTAGNVGIGTTTPSERLHVSGSIRVTGAYYDSSNSSGSAGQVLTSVSGGTNWVSLSGTSGVDGTGMSNQVAFWSDADTITGNDSLQWDGSKLTIVGTLEATEKSFVIEHPTKPGSKLVYGVLEGPEHAVYCRGRISGPVLELPEEWTGLVDQETITVQLTPIGKHQNLYVDSIVENTVIIKNADIFSSKIDAFYFVQGTRKDVKPLQTVRPA